ncbi:hypothetical protein Bphy_6899 (plasmid) [Paraburkholderia phymatum STM815]|uniref:Uncharacterized protein n=1 Tax=Paraburkholderia phymatum (strain DSM 17167 / CIP 108236 / LMG 21445 / STM815) TaxID=391038 RepID=B2JTK7_PARP8|nr:hypothetical protein Bphy_6899 [Paraburkholderia phymatum STM815]
MRAEGVAVDLAVCAGAKIQIAGKTRFQFRPDLREQIVRHDAVEHLLLRAHRSLAPPGRSVTSIWMSSMLRFLICMMEVTICLSHDRPA